MNPFFVQQKRHQTFTPREHVMVLNYFRLYESFRYIFQIGTVPFGIIPTPCERSTKVNWSPTTLTTPN